MMHIDNTSTPVLVLKSAGHGGLGITRSLGRLGIPVYNLDSKPWTPAFSSRYSRGKFIWDIYDAPAEASIAYLMDIAKNLRQRCILMPTTDRAAIFVADNAGVLKEKFIFPNQSPETVHSLFSKKEMYYLAKKFHIPTAETVFPESKRDVLHFLESAVFPIMLKGIDGRRLRKRAGKPMFIVRNERELLEKYEAIEDPGQPNLMLQEYIPGGDDTIWMFNGYFNESSECLAGFTGKKIRQSPVYTGPTSLGICLRNDTVDRTTRAFMKAIGYKGILDIGYRYDCRDGLYKVLDVNPRIGATFRLFVAENGMDVARTLYLDLTGQPVTPASIREGRKWIVEDADLVSCLNYRKDGKLTFMEWIRSFRGVQEAAFFALDDLFPVFKRCITDLRAPLRRVYRKA